MSCLNPKKLITEYIDSLINLVDIHTEEQLQKYPDNSFFTIKENDFKKKKKNYCSKYQEQNEPRLEDEKDVYMYKDEFKLYENPLRKNRLKYKFEPTKPESEKTRVWDYLNGVRDEMIKQLREVQTEALKKLEIIKNELDLDYDESKDDKDAKEEEVLSRVFCQRFPFIIKINKLDRHFEQTVFVDEEALEFNLLLIDVEFFLGKFELTLLKYKLFFFYLEYNS